MTQEDFINAIKYRDTLIGDDSIIVTGRITFEAHCQHSKFIPAPKELVRENVARELLGFVYDFNQQELYRAILELQQVNPFDYAAHSVAVEKVMRAARKQPPKP